MKIPDLLTAKRLRHLEAMVAEISAKELNSKIVGDEIFKLIQVSDREDYESGHLPHSEHIQITEIEQEASSRFRKFQQIVLYTQETSSIVANAAAEKLQKLGFSNVVVLRGGKEEWIKAGYDLVGQKASEEND